MEIYFIGSILIPISLYLFIYRPNYLYQLTVFSIPFTGTSVFKLSFSNLEMEGIRASMWLGILCLARFTLNLLAKGKLKISPRQRVSFWLVILLILVCVLSLIMPILINGKLQILDSYSKYLTYADSIPLKFRFQYVTQVIYFVFGALLTIYFVTVNNTTDAILKTIRIYIAASLFLCWWGLLEYILFYLGIQYPAFLFNQNSLNHNGTIMLGSFPRITSASLEPSILSQQLLTVLPLLFWPFWEGKNYLNLSKISLSLLLLVIVLILSTSMTAIVGIALFVLMITWQYLKKRVPSKNGIIIIGITIVLIIVTAPFVISNLITKLASYSGAERIKALVFGFDYFLKYPVLGIGWGVFPSWDLIVCILTGTGIVGLLVFFFLYRAIWVNKKLLQNNGEFNTLAKSIWHSWILLLMVSETSGFIFHSQYFWLILGLVISGMGINFKVLPNEPLKVNS